ncbi:HAD family hydrolase [Tenacibaculum tangerinum]|uniref:phosphoserine phosphatase n=1 Tax=Tenacibaculum tangerinum TaxID=3038772 RepID=A0ABY8L0Y9_9FLAO|nr:HAD family hydrolase [Tenacibaculum tangerinum]WGH75132.1 HAD family hydrolase [Tenacibaculum tangerinum]
MSKIVQMNLVLLAVCFILSCNTDTKKDKNNEVMLSDPLPSFNTSEAKKNIIDFVTSVTDSTSTKFVKKENRIVVFDNDGTLWVEQPIPSQLFFAFDRIQELAKNNPDWEHKMPFKAVLEEDTEAISKLHKKDLVEIVGTAHAVDNVTNFDAIVNNWLKTAKHPILNRNYTQLVYKPMLELLNYLRAKDFTIYIVSGGSQEFMRAWAPEIYGIPKKNIIGSTFEREVVEKGDTISIAQTKNLEFFDDHQGKVVAIDKFIGQKPIMIVGNSDGDLEMMKYSDTNNPLPTFMLYLDHTDGEREFLYTKNTPAGKLMEGKKVAKERNWTIINMKTDWKTVF